ncbi:MAG: undecaprenyl-phosphate glucose phosphotransferase [Anaerolineaceae bacterium]|nr:undecaprenyl-phosphate glucose phosphotransferase [Anaerolineaceae bacterium]
MATQPGHDRPAAEGRPGDVGGNPATDRLNPALRTARTGRIRLLLNLLRLLLDVIMLAAAFALAYRARNAFELFSIPTNPPRLEQFVPTLLLHVGTILLVLYASRLYHLARSVSTLDQMRRILGATLLGAVLAYGLQGLVLDLLLNATEYQVDYPRSLFFYVLLFSIVLVEFGRSLYRTLRAWLRRRGLDNETLLIIGAGDVAHDMSARIRADSGMGYNLIGVVARDRNGPSPATGVDVIGNFADIPRLIDNFDVEQVIIALPEAQREELEELINLCRRGQVDIKVYPDLFTWVAGDLNVDEMGGTPLLTVRDIALRGWKLSLKRAMDICVSFCGLVLLSPVLLLTALLVRLESTGPAFYIQERMGLDGQSFPMIKFRSMQADAERGGPGWTVRDDPRQTRLGRFLRRSNWDEIPQLINVLLGHMSLVGPRPERPVYVTRFRDQIPRYMERHREKSGMTGWAQVNGLRGDTSIAERTHFDLWYVENWSVWLDLRIILRTIWLILLRRDRAY